jgi:hypothetical protein
MWYESVQMTVGEAETHLQTMLDFRADLQEFLQAKRQLLELKAYADRDHMMGHFDSNAVETRGREIMERLLEWRTTVARRLADATGITDACGIPSQIKILPPPRIGGYSHTLNIYQAVLEDSLPYDYDLPLQKVADVVDQTVFACERLLSEVKRQEMDPPSPLAKVPGAVSRGFGFFFKTDFDRSLVKWLVVILLVGLILRYVFGLPLEQLGQIIYKLFEKHV